MREALKVVVAVGVALALWFVFDGSAQDLPAFDPPPVAVDPLEVTVYGGRRVRARLAPSLARPRLRHLLSAPRRTLGSQLDHRGAARGRVHRP